MCNERCIGVLFVKQIMDLKYFMLKKNVKKNIRKECKKKILKKNVLSSYIR